MKKVLYFLSTLAIGLFIHVVFYRYLSVFGVSPHLLLLLVVAHGFLLGALMGESLGFFWGLAVDAIGVSFFGLQTLLFSVAGYAAGKLSRRVASERPAAQLVIGAVSSIYYFTASSIIRSSLDPVGHLISWPKVIFGTIFNVLIAVAVFWVLELWIRLWGLKSELN